MAPASRRSGSRSKGAPEMSLTHFAHAASDLMEFQEIAGGFT